MSRRALSMFCITIVVTLTTISAIRAEDKQMDTFKSLKVGMTAPDFTLKDGDGIEHSLRNYLGQKNVALAFYPKDFTGG
jgi:cytochrome oxidase Cu insertion factor (SCO1/SenC/PrrC family)